MDVSGKIYIISDNKSLDGGVKEWLKHMIDDEGCIAINNIYDVKFNKGDSLFVNNVCNDFFFNTRVLLFLSKKINMYFVLHADICPSNKFFVKFMKYFNGTICTNKFIYDKMISICAGLDHVYIPNNYKYDIIKSEYNISDHIRMHYIGRLSSEKNLPMLIKAMKNINVKLYIYGKSDSEEYLEYLTYLCDYYNVKDKIIFMGYEDDKNKLYQTANLIILPSVHEGLPYCLLEASQYKKTIISHNISGIDYHINNGIYFEYNGISSNDFKNVLFVENYRVLLKMIGYVECKIDINNVNLNPFNYLYNKNKKGSKIKVLVPPEFMMEKNDKIKTAMELYDMNVLKLTNIINETLYIKYGDGL